jgi:hypothetical protein
MYFLVHEDTCNTNISNAKTGESVSWMPNNVWMYWYLEFSISTGCTSIPAIIIIGH